MHSHSKANVLYIFYILYIFNFRFYPTVLTVVLMLQCCVCQSSVVCLSLTICIVA